MSLVNNQLSTFVKTYVKPQDKDVEQKGSEADSQSLEKTPNFPGGRCASAVPPVFPSAHLNIPGTICTITSYSMRSGSSQPYSLPSSLKSVPSASAPSILCYPPLSNPHARALLLYHCNVHPRCSRGLNIPSSAVLQCCTLFVIHIQFTIIPNFTTPSMFSSELYCLTVRCYRAV